MIRMYMNKFVSTALSSRFTLLDMVLRGRYDVYDRSYPLPSLSAYNITMKIN